MTSERYRRVWEKLREIDENAGERLMDDFKMEKKDWLMMRHVLSLKPLQKKTPS